MHGFVTLTTKVILPIAREVYGNNRKERRFYQMKILVEVPTKYATLFSFTAMGNMGDDKFYGFSDIFGLAAGNHIILREHEDGKAEVIQKKLKEKVAWRDGIDNEKK